MLIILPFIGFGALYWFGRLQPSKLVISLAVGLPMLTLIISGISPVIRVSQRVNDSNLQARFVEGNGLELTWSLDDPANALAWGARGPRFKTSRPDHKIHDKWVSWSSFHFPFEEGVWLYIA